MADEIEYKLEDVEATSVAPEDIDQTFRSSCIGMEQHHSPGSSPFTTKHHI